MGSCVATNPCVQWSVDRYPRERWARCKGQRSVIINLLSREENAQSCSLCSAIHRAYMAFLSILYVLILETHDWLKIFHVPFLNCPHVLKCNLCVFFLLFNCDSICLGCLLLSSYFFGLFILCLVCILGPPFSHPHLCNQFTYLSPVSHFLFSPSLAFLLFPPW